MGQENRRTPQTVILPEQCWCYSIDWNEENCSIMALIHRQKNRDIENFNLFTNKMFKFTANTVPGMYPAQPYPGQYNAGVPYAPTGLYTAPGQQFTYPPPGQPYANAPPPGQQYNNPLPSYDETTGNKTPMQW